ncbi:class II aaRS and biotin synthetase [Cenococcum geophilum]
MASEQGLRDAQSNERQKPGKPKRLARRLPPRYPGSRKRSLEKSLKATSIQTNTSKSGLGRSTSSGGAKNLIRMLYFASTSGYTFAKLSKVTLYKVPTQIPNQYFTGRVRGEISGHQETLKDVEIQVGARITTKRSYRNILRFYNVKAEGVSMQIMCEVKKATGTPFVEQHEHLRRDWIGVVGFPGRTQSKSRDSGELSIFAREVFLLTPCLHQLPTVHYGFKDQEQRHRQRFLDLITNDSTRNTFTARTKIVKYIRDFFDSRDFLEVQTPMMNKIAGGATAKPSKTFHSDLGILDVNSEMRVSNLTYNPEFTTCEFYWAFADVYDIMDLTEELVSGMVKAVTGGYVTKYHTQHGEEIKMIPALEEATGEKFPPSDQLHTTETNEFLQRVLKKMKIECPPPLTNARMIDRLVGEYIDHPEMMSPLAKTDRSIKGLCERFEVFVCKKEIVNAYTEFTFF